MEIICFHNPDEENGYLSNWYESKFIVDHVKFSSMEQFMMYQKVITFQDQTIAKEHPEADKEEIYKMLK